MGKVFVHVIAGRSAPIPSFSHQTGVSPSPTSDVNLGGVHVTQPYGQNGHHSLGLAEPMLGRRL